MRIFFQNSIATHCKRVVSITSPDTLVDNILSKDNKPEALRALVKAVKRNVIYSNQVQNYLGSLLSKPETLVDEKVKIAQVLGMFQTVFSAKTLGIALLGSEVGTDELFERFLVNMTVHGANGSSEASLGDLLPNYVGEKNAHVRKALIDGLCESKQPLAISLLRKYGEVKQRPHSQLALDKANEIESSLSGCLFFSVPKW
jgi:hypothetical protein